MSSALYRVTVRDLHGLSIDLEFVLATTDIEWVFTEPSFVGRVLADSLDADAIVSLWPDVDRDDLYSFANAWLATHAEEAIDARSIELHDEVNHPLVLPSLHELTEELARPLRARWATDPSAVLLELRAAMHAESSRLQLDDALEIYRAGTLDEVVREVASARHDRLASVEVRASLRFRVRDPKWIAHLAVGACFDSTAYPT